MSSQMITQGLGAEIWKQVDEELEAIGHDFTDPKFYALKHVVEILSSNQPQAVVEEVRGAAGSGRGAHKRAPRSTHSCCMRCSESSCGPAGLRVACVCTVSQYQGGIPHSLSPIPTPCVQLRGQEARLIALVDALATGYHSGFARSIQNYSQILQLFGDATQQVDGLKKSLADAHRQLAVQSRHLHQQVTDQGGLNRRELPCTR
jgi:hypothetical protein